jgi:hypothetical protein
LRDIPPSIPSSPRDVVLSTPGIGLAFKAVDDELEDIASHTDRGKVKGFKANTLIVTCSVAFG